MPELKRFLYHAEHTHCYTYFSIRGDFDPDAVTALLGLTPDETTKAGEPRYFRGVSRGTYAFSSWDFGRCDEYDVIVENQMRKTIAPLLDKVELLKKIKRENDVFFSLVVVPTIRYDEPVPVVAPSLDVMQFCCDTGTEFDLDMYLSCPDGPQDGAVLELSE